MTDSDDELNTKCNEVLKKCFDLDYPTEDLAEEAIDCVERLLKKLKED